jgi:hypothetical protein
MFMFPVVASSTCNFFNARNADGNPPQNLNQPWQFASSTCVFTYPQEFFAARATTSTTTQNVFITGYANPATTSATTSFGIYPYFSAGEIVLVFFALIFTFYIVAKSVISAIWNITTGKKYLQYNGGDVEIRHDN